MSSAINTPGKRKRARDGIEYDYLPRTPGTMFTMDLGSQPRSGATYFEPPVIPIQPPVRCHFDRNEDFAIGGITSWPQDSLQDPCSRHDSYFGNASFFENQFEAPRLNYTFRPLERDDNLPHAEAHPRSQLGQIEYNTNSLTRGASPPTGLDQSDLPIANTISDWVTKSRNLTMLPPEITIDSPSSVAPPSTQFLDPPSVLEVEPRPSTDLAMTMARRRQHLYHWGSQTSSSSENYFQTPPSSLSTSEGKHDVGWYSGSTNLPERHQRHSISTDTSELSGHGSGSLQPVVYTPQSSSRGDWPGTSHNLPRISALTKGLQEGRSESCARCRSLSYLSSFEQNQMFFCSRETMRELSKFA
ncbi:uncharacterized protein LY89DRAFT_2602 [Mollisia scopiformis]|uniref:Uncharacterized protein n=1 Tax=Mollisia scopiformis TaxID=149040 RepID=A0A194XTY7_MOLSC|nr:uncharacterized protein LY89DRAFT_2602 [Mollisia scopiformis]KUJ23785.1 hypothetical protein LY89DRAFT_2602 [Mollisia scopiformis]